MSQIEKNSDAVKPRSYRKGLAKTAQNLLQPLKIFHRQTAIQEEDWEDIESALLMADLGIKTTSVLVEDLQKRSKKLLKNQGDPLEFLRETLADKLIDILGSSQRPLDIPKGQGTILLAVGANGSGKTTTLGKMAFAWQQRGYKTLLVAGDCFRAAAVEQLGIWAQRAGCDFMQADSEKRDAAALAYDAGMRVKAQGYDLALMDTAGRLHNAENLMAELAKIKRVLAKTNPAAPQETLLILDATIGQNALRQAEIFHEKIGLTGLIVTKLDGTAKGGMVVQLAETLALPIYAIGVGEQISDLQDFDVESFCRGLVGLDPKRSLT